MRTLTTRMPHRWTSAALIGLVALLATLWVPTVARADAGAEAAFVAAVNRERAAAGLPSLAVADDLVAVARTHSRRMADADDLHHNPSLAAEVSNWQVVGENVGRGPDVDVVHSAFMGSPAHRDNILDARWTQVGVGVEVRDGTVWVTEVFRQPEAAPPPPPPEPEAPPPPPEPEAPPEPTADPAPAAEPEPEADPEPADVEAAAEDPADTAGMPADADEATRGTAEADDEAAPAEATDHDDPEPADAPESARPLVMLARVAADDAALDAAARQ